MLHFNVKQGHFYDPRSFHAKPQGGVLYYILLALVSSSQFTVIQVKL